MNKERSTIYREIINNCTYKDCRHSCSHCQKQWSREERPLIRHSNCPLFIVLTCQRRKHFPYTCNGCKDSSVYTNLKRYYDCADANDLSRQNKHVPRIYQGINKEDIRTIDSIVAPSVLNEQSLHHIYETSEVLKSICSERMIRRYLYNGYLSVKAYQLPRCVRYSHK